MIRPFTALHTKGIPISFYVEDAVIDSIEVDETETAVAFHFATGFYMFDRDGKESKSLANATMYVCLEEGERVPDNIFIARKVHVFRRVRYNRFRKNVLKKKMIVHDILYSHHSQSVIVEGAAKGHFAVQLDHVKDIRFTYYEPHVKVYDNTIVNRRDVFRLKKA